ncbi:hypothetical protein JRQ81_003353 [Phrynocephalus forsythii]|uniref:Uncharacterized protein n=1 Tax=Phrynocephalus forsythii TaxID=171643 RepID=A0A9Q1AX49_9SAUR|nr:hypothetical protein JRQ81_003353 [Phrynocephalus forsythii]
MRKRERERELAIRSAASWSDRREACGAAWLRAPGGGKAPSQSGSGPGDEMATVTEDEAHVKEEPENVTIPEASEKLVSPYGKWEKGPESRSSTEKEERSSAYKVQDKTLQKKEEALKNLDQIVIQQLIHTEGGTITCPNMGVAKSVHGYLQYQVSP